MVEFMYMMLLIVCQEEQTNSLSAKVALKRVGKLLVGRNPIQKRQQALPQSASYIPRKQQQPGTTPQGAEQHVPLTQATEQHVPLTPAAQPSPVAEQHAPSTPTAPHSPAMEALTSFKPVAPQPVPLPPTAQHLGQSKRASFYNINPGVWARLRAYAASKRTPDFPQRLKAFVMAEARMWLQFILTNLAPSEIRILIIELHTNLFPARTLVLNNARDVAVKLRVLYVMREFQATCQPASVSASRTAHKPPAVPAQQASLATCSDAEAPAFACTRAPVRSLARPMMKVPLRGFVVENIDDDMRLLLVGSHVEKVIIDLELE
eukprot:248519-Pleurochrysis_carterae.AAC.1